MSVDERDVSIVFAQQPNRKFTLQLEAKVQGFGIDMTLFTAGEGITPQLAINAAVKTLTQRFDDLGVLLYMRKL